MLPVFGSPGFVDCTDVRVLQSGQAVGLALEVGAFAGIQVAALVQERKLAKLEEESK